jgi:proline dehydrogenase
MLRWTFLRISESRWLRDRVPRWGIARGAVARFMPGERLEDALGACRDFQEQGMTNILTYLGENVATEEEAEEMTIRYLEALDGVAENGVKAEISVKLTQLGLDQSFDLCFRNMIRIVERAEARGNFVWIDMEATPYVDGTLQQFRRLRDSHEKVGVCLQAYLYRTEQDLASLLPLAPAIRVVKGAYKEPASVAYRRKADVDESYFRMARTLLEQRSREGKTPPAFATHDPALTARLQEAAREAGVPPQDFEFQLLYGIQRAQQEELARAGHRVQVLISYGEAWFPWFMRRIAERPANVLFVLRNLFG